MISGAGWVAQFRRPPRFESIGPGTPEGVDWIEEKPVLFFDDGGRGWIPTEGEPKLVMLDSGFTGYVKVAQPVAITNVLGSSVMGQEGYAVLYDDGTVKIVSPERGG